MPVSDQGASSGRYSLIPRTLIFLRKNEQVLLIKGAPHKRLWANRYNGLGGHIEPGEAALSAARRELQEEAGLVAPSLRLCGVVMVDTGQAPGVGLFIFTGEWAGGELRASPEGSLEWISSLALEGLPLVEDLPLLLPRVLAHQPGDPPFSAHSWYNTGGRLQMQFDEP